MQIGRNDEVDELAKASLLLPPTEPPCPRLSSYKLRVKREVSRITESEIQNQVQPSHVPEYPDRTNFIGYFTYINGRQQWIKSPYTRKSKDDRGILFRIRSGHTKSLDHFYRLGIIDSAAPCRLCEQEVTESVQHQLLHCPALRDHLALPLSRLANAVGDSLDINTCWTHPKEWRKLLITAEKAGAML
jgi:hypothetical protein